MTEWRAFRTEPSIAAAQARRDRNRLAAAQDEILALRTALNKPFRGAIAALEKTPLRVGLRAARALRRRPAHAPAPTAASPRGVALVIDDNWPQPDRDSGSVDICNLLQALNHLGFDVTLAAAKQHTGPQPARDALLAQGFRCLSTADAPSLDAYLHAHGHRFDLCVLCRVFCGGEYLEAVLQHCIKSRIVFNTIDLNFLREERKALLLKDSKLLQIAKDIRPREEHVIRMSDATLLVSQAELDLLAATIPEALTVLLPLARPLRPPAAPFSARHGIGFIGGFAHAPNIDAVRYFLAEIWPLIHAAKPDLPFSIVGSDAPSDLILGAPGPVRLLGHLPDITPWFESLRLTIAPLRFGAGAKGKIASSLAAGVPCIATQLAAEGMALAEQSGVLTAETPAAFAAAVIALHGDEQRWSTLSAGALAHAPSLNAWRENLNSVLERIGL